jgi:hypothetical protein
MDIGTFYSLFSATCFTLVGLWWNVVERRAEWATDPRRRRLAGGIYATFLLPGVMGLFAQVSPESPAMWRSTFAVVAIVGAVTTLRLIGIERGSSLPGPFTRNRWAVALLYLAILVLGLFPAAAAPLGAAPIQVAATLLIGLVVIGHGLTWEFMTDSSDAAAE